MNNDDSSFKDFCKIKKWKLKVGYVSLKKNFRQWMVVLNSLMALNDDVYIELVKN